PSPSAMLPRRITRSGLVASGLTVMVFIPIWIWFGGIIGRRPMLSTAGDGAQGRILFVAGRPGRGLGIPVGEKRQQNRQNHEQGGDAKHPMRRTLVHDPAKQ